ncbi:MAG: ferritin [Planctomycetota bacterium]|jgi:ferritin
MAFLTESMVSAINQQIKNEFEASYVYLGMASYFDQANFDGFASWMRSQSTEEWAHGMRLFDFLLYHNAAPELGSIEGPNLSYESPLHAFQTALAHEKQVTKQIFSLYELAMSERAYAAKAEIEWFIAEQAEEEKTAGDIVDRLEMVGTDIAALLVLDRDLGARSGGSS